MEIEIDDQHERTIDNAGVSFKAIDPARQDGPHEIELPAVSGTIDPQAITGQIQHDGGVAFSTSNGTVQFSNLVTDLDGRVMTGEVAGQRVRLFDLSLGHSKHDHHDRYDVELDHVDGSFASEAASILNETLAVDIFSSNLRVEMELKLSTR
ncbi:MAG: hypothetical protein M9890_09325 [Thermomicrobiales bacterium]|nr:hypothetical protein [Thermomicrobiales bacterium]